MFSSINFSGSTTGHSGNYYLQINTMRPNMGYTGFDVRGMADISDGIQAKSVYLVQYAQPALKNFGPNPMYVPQLGGEVLYTLLSHYPVRFENVPSYVTIKAGDVTVSPNTKFTPPAPDVIASNGDGVTVRLIFSANNTGQDRSTENTFRMRHYSGSTIVSDGAVYINTRQTGEVTQTISVSPSTVSVPATGGTKEFRVATSASWSVTSTIPSWLTLSQTAGTGDATVTFTAAATTGQTTRYVTLVLETANGSDMVSVVQPVGEELKLTALDAGTIGWFTNNTAFTTTIQYSKNNGAWTDITASLNGNMISVAAGDQVRFRGDNMAYATAQYRNTFGGTARFNISGWLTSLLNKEDYRSVWTLQAPYTFAYLFEGSEAVDASGMPAAPGVPHPRPRRRKRRHGCLITLLVLVALVVGAYWVVAHPIDEKLAFTPQEQSSVNGSLSWSMPGMPYYLLALGSDAREGDEFSRTDTMVLVRVDMLGGKLTLLSIPHDTMVEIPGHGTQKINAAYAFGGVGGAVNAVSKLTGVPIHHVAVVHFDELVGLVDYLGGVTVNVPVGVEYDNYSGLSIDSGVQTLDGETALAWARTRYSYERGDFQRQENQRILITAIMNRMLSLSPKRIPGALDQMGDLIGTDLRCYNLVPLFLRFKLANPVVYSTSVPSDTAMVDGVSYVVADEAALASLMRTIDSGGDPGTPVN